MKVLNSGSHIKSATIVRLLHKVKIVLLYGNIYIAITQFDNVI